MKIIDAILILAILGVGSVYYMQKRKPGSCYRGQMQLTDEVKAFIDADFAKAAGRTSEIAGLQDLANRTEAVGRKFADLETVREQNRKVFIETTAAISAVAKYKKRIASEYKTLVANTTKQSLAVCSKPKALGR